MSGQQAAEVVRVQAVHVFLRRNAFNHDRRCKLGGQRQLHQDAMHARIGIEPVDEGEYGRERAVAGQQMLFETNADLAAGPDLVAYIYLRRRIVAHHDHGQAGRDACGVEPVGARFPVGAHFLRELLAVDDHGCHCLPLGARA